MFFILNASILKATHSVSRCLGFDVDGVGWISGGLEDSSMTGIVRLRFPVTVDGADMTFFSKVAFT